MLILIFIFFLLFGCAYEFIKFYLKNKNKREENEDDDSFEDMADVENQIRRNNSNISQEDKKLTGKEKTMCVFLGFLGVLLQPLYLLFYILFAIVDFFRRFNCWFVYFPN